ncbi:MAG: hypothetical protein V3V14_06210 [Saprospiraceae bacterium]
MILSLKKLIFRLLYRIWDVKQKRKLQKINSFDQVCVFDIDNTLTISQLGKPVNHLSPIPRDGMINYVKELINQGKKVIFLSARNFNLFDNTIDWLQHQGIFDKDKNELFLVHSSISKIEYLKKLIESNKAVLFIDDLSYNHENSNIKYYKETEQEINKLNIEFKGLDFISKLKNEPKKF